MKHNRIKPVAVLFALAIGAIPHPAQTATLKVGDAAPKLQPAKWVKGERVKEFARDKVYVVEFWATWCGPCRVSIPHLNALHDRFKSKGLIVIGQDVWEMQPGAVAPFVKEMGTNMTYRIALDTTDGVMARTWMEAAGQSGIPAAFVVDKRGIVAWIGHPTELNDSILEPILAGTFDVAKAAEAYTRRRALDEKLRTLLTEFRRLVENEKWDEAERALDEAGKVWPEEHRKNFELTRFEFLLDRRQYREAYQAASNLSDARPQDAMMQNSIAWTIATKDEVAERDLNLAERIARRAHNVPDLGNVEQAEILDTLARVLFLKGERNAAIEHEEQAVRLARGDRKTQFEKVLSDYRAGRVPNESHLRGLERQINRSIRKGQWNTAGAALLELEGSLPEAERARLDTYHFRIQLGRGNYDAAAGLAERLAREGEKNAMMLNSLAWGVAIRDDAKRGELELAEQVARKANAVTKGANSEILDTLARLVFRKGDNTAAIGLQEKAVRFAKGKRKTQFQETLDSYRAGKLPKAY